MQLVETHQFNRNHKFFDEFSRISHLSKNLYNAALYDTRQHFFKTEKYKKYAVIAGEFAKGNPDYKALPAKVAQQTLKLVDQNFKSFFALIRKKLPAKIPGYLDKSGNYVTIYTKQALSFRDPGLIKLSGTDIKIKTDKQNINQVRLVPHGNYFSIEIIYSVDLKELKTEGNLAAIDLGLNNLAACVTNVSEPFIINGRPVKAMNHYYNKHIAKQLSIQEHRKQGKTSHKTKHLARKRKNKIADYMHKASTMIINHLVSHNIFLLFIGENKGWKQEINIGKRNNQNFVNIPFTKFKRMLQYKAAKHGITVHFQEESYTSKASFLSDDHIPVYGDENIPKFSGYRVKRGLYKIKGIKKFINADVNGAYNILRKAVGNFQYDPILVCSRPVIKNISFN